MDQPQNITPYRISGFGLDVQVLNYGARLHQICLDGQDHHLIMAYDDLGDYLQDRQYRGAVVGPVANRIAMAKGMINGQSHVFDANELDQQTLHGGRHGISQMFWQATQHHKNSITLTCQQEDGVDGFPGRRNYQITYHINADGLTCDLQVETDRPTPIDLTLHPYFNLDGGGDIGSHDIQINAASYLPRDDQNCPIGKVWPVANTKFDFTKMTSLEDYVTGGLPPIDHYFIYDLNQTKSGGDALRHLARLQSRKSGLRLDISATSDGVQFYMGQGIEGQPFKGLCLEPQQYPNALNHPHFPNIIITPDQPYRHHINYCFSQIEAAN